MKTQKILAPRGDTASGAVAAVVEAVREIPLPAEAENLAPDERAIFDDVLTMRTPSEWSPVDLRVAVSLARDLVAMERHAAALVAEGDIVRNKVNPRHRLVDAAMARVHRSMRSLQIHGRSRWGESRDVARMRRPVIEAVGALVATAPDPASQDDDDLLARPGL